MPTTTNFGWTTPADTDLVKDGAAAIRTLAGNIDTSLVDLKGGTTGQVLAKNSNTDLDFTWSADAGIPATIVDAKGDIIAATAADTVSRLAVGANDTVLTADSSTGTGLKWAAPIAAGANWSLLNSGGTSLSGTTTTISGISGKDKLMILVKDASTTSNGNTINVRFNTDTGSNYAQVGSEFAFASTYNTANFTTSSGLTNTEAYIGRMSNQSNSAVDGFLLVTGCNSAGVKVYNFHGMASDATGSGQRSYTGGGYYNSASTISSVSINTANNFDGGTVYIYGSA